MRILAMSDIHDNVEAVRRLRQIESNRFDAVMVAGDIGCAAAQEIMDILSTFGCPVMYVLGNWDYDLAYDAKFTSATIHLHLRPISMSGLVFVGFSGCKVGWGKNPIASFEETALLARHPYIIIDDLGIPILKTGASKNGENLNAILESFRQDRQATNELIAKKNRMAMLQVFREAGYRRDRAVIVTHERQYRLSDLFPGLPLHIFGHHHGFKVTTSRGTNFINVSALDQREVVVSPASWSALRPSRKGQPSVFDFGRYTIIETTSNRINSVVSTRIYPDPPHINRTGIGFRGPLKYETPEERTYIARCKQTPAGLRSYHALPDVRPGDPPRVHRAVVAASE